MQNEEEGNVSVKPGHGSDNDNRGIHHPLRPARTETAPVGTEHGALHLEPFEQEQFADEHHYEVIHGQAHDHNHNHIHTIGSARTPWYGTTIVLLSEVMGTGILSLPYAAKTLGWGWTLVALPFFAIVATYSGWLLAQVQSNFPEFSSYSQAANHLMGPKFGGFTKVSMLLFWGATAVYYLIALSDGITDVVGDVIGCQYQRSFLAVLLLILPCQCRDFYNISKYLSGPSTLAILILMVMILIHLWKDSANEDAFVNPSTTVGPVPETSLLDFLEALSAFVFAYQGQSIYLELMSEMKEARQFPRACSLAYVFMCLIYTLTVVVAYGIQGDQTPEFLPDALPDGWTRRIGGVLVALHIAVSYVIACQPLHDWLHLQFFPQTHQDESRGGKFHWLVVTMGYLLFGYFVGNLIPFFADVQALIGSLFGAPIIFGWPAAFYAVMIRRKTTSWNEARLEMGLGNAVTCFLFLFVCTSLFCLLGTTGAIQSIVEDAKDASAPFQCDASE